MPVSATVGTSGNNADRSGLDTALDIGGLRCRKVALLQAKKATGGSADIGSKTKQLLKLAARPSVGFYLLYHMSQHPLQTPAPSVCSAKTLRDVIINAERNPAAKSLMLDIREYGWDWASFMSFGLFDAYSEIGPPFNTVDDALQQLGDGDIANLPTYLHVIAINDESRVYELRNNLLALYHERDWALQKQHNNENSGLQHRL